VRVVDDSNETFESQNTTTCTLYLIRHGEAEHNVKEEQAKAAASKRLSAAGFDLKEPEAQAAIEKARRSVLADNSLYDPPLSQNGKEMTAEPRATIERLIGGGLPAPTVVLVSPLQRTLQTAALVFPAHQNVSAREVLRERRTGHACDSRSPAHLLAKRLTFSHINLSEIVRIDSESSQSNAGDLQPSSTCSIDISNSSTSDGDSGGEGGAGAGAGIDVSNGSTGDGGSGGGEGGSSHGDSTTLTGGECGCECSSGQVPVEDSSMLRRRTLQLMELLTEHSEHSAVAIVTHKGFIRELERGPFCQPEATECANGEVRVYRVSVATEAGGSQRVASTCLYP